MSKSTHRLPLVIAEALAKRIKAELAPSCEKIEIVGSIRRRKNDIGDIELLAIPRYQPSLLPEVPGQSLLDVKLEELVYDERLIRANKGETLKRFYVGSLHGQGKLFAVEICISTPERWPVELAIKTGPAQFSHNLVKPRSQRGFLPSDCQIRDGWQVYRGDEHLTFANERAFIEFVFGRYIEPPARGISEIEWQVPLMDGV